MYTDLIYCIHMMSRIKITVFPRQQWPIDLCNGDWFCYL
jgi:hypothetical protein